MYSVFVRTGRVGNQPSLQYGRPVYGDAKRPADVRWLGVNDHDCAMSIKRTLERVGDMIRNVDHSLFVELLRWALLDSKEIGVSENVGHAVAKQIWDEWTKSKRNRIAHKADSFTDEQRLELAMAYVHSRAGAFQLQPVHIPHNKILTLATPIGVLYKNNRESNVADLQKNLTPEGIKVVRLTIGKHQVEQPDLAGDQRFAVINPTAGKKNHATY